MLYGVVCNRTMRIEENFIYKKKDLVARLDEDERRDLRECDCVVPETPSGHFCAVHILDTEEKLNKFISGYYNLNPDDYEDGGANWSFVEKKDLWEIDDNVSLTKEEALEYLRSYIEK